MQKWASEYGLSLEQVQTAVDKWAKDVCRDGSKTTSRCVWRTTVKNSSKAASCFDELGRKDVQELEQLKAQVWTEPSERCDVCEGCYARTSCATLPLRLRE